MTESEKFELFKGIQLSEYSDENVRKYHFLAKNFFSGKLEKFLAVVWRCSRYLQGPPDIVLRSRKQITTIRLVDKKYLRKTKIWSQKKTLSCIPLYIVAT